MENYFPLIAFYALVAFMELAVAIAFFRLNNIRFSLLPFTLLAILLSLVIYANLASLLDGMLGSIYLQAAALWSIGIVFQALFIYASSRGEIDIGKSLACASLMKFASFTMLFVFFYIVV